MENNFGRKPITPWKKHELKKVMVEEMRLQAWKQFWEETNNTSEKTWTQESDGENEVTSMGNISGRKPITPSKKQSM